ncbi:MAG TPA: hypothetical protein VEC12_04280 [Bacteroidia bacterium]|nr:hypothetical protein [Bacteroidia bacterium]
MNFPDFIEKIVLEKEYHQLTAGEKAGLAEWIKNEEEYSSIRALLLKMNVSGIGEEQLAPSVKTKEKLKAAFAEKHKEPSRLLVKRRVGIISAAASVIIVLAAVFLLVDKDPVPQPQVSEVKKETPSIPTPAPEQEPETKTETPADNTIKPSPEKEIKETSVPQPAQPEETANNSVALADQPDLAGLTVVVF